MKNGKIVGHTDNYIQAHVEGKTNLINRIQQVTLKENRTTFVKCALG